MFFHERVNLAHLDSSPGGKVRKGFAFVRYWGPFGVKVLSEIPGFHMSRSIYPWAKKPVPSSQLNSYLIEIIIIYWF